RLGAGGRWFNGLGQIPFHPHVQYLACCDSISRLSAIRFLPGLMPFLRGVPETLGSSPKGLICKDSQFETSSLAFLSDRAPTSPSVFPLFPCCDNVAGDDRAIFPEPVDIKWNSGRVTNGIKTSSHGTEQWRAFTLISQPPSLPGTWRPQYLCLVWHMTLNETLKVKVKPQNCDHCNRHPLEVSLLPPSLDDLYIAQNATISCLVSGMETPHSLEVSWNRGSWGPLVVVSRDPVLQEDGTCNATSILRVCVEEWQAGEEFTCTVKHQDFPSAIVKTIRKVHGQNSVSLRAPSVYVSPPHTEELALQEPTHITCLASGFQPRHILVTWTQQDRPVPQEAYINIGPMQEAGKEERYFIYSKLNVLASEWELGNTYTCVVGHKGLSMTFIHRSVDKSSGKPTAVNVSVILSDTNVTCY
uniref:Ig-like domain-containing protein n=1 Tax=Chelonoidis abingdonii TaxID=106734 RepID=A0A8C0JAY2_CHEAB